MKPSSCLLQAIATAVAIAALAGCATVPTLTPPPALRLEGVPPIPVALLESAQRYNRVAGHAFVDWHPTRREMLVAHRAPDASTTQLFRLRSPLAAPEPLTDGRDPVTSAQWEPRQGRYIVFARGSGGDEAYQLFRLDPETRSTMQITPDGQRHAWVDWVRSRSLALVASVPLDRTAAAGRRGDVATTLSLFDPLDPLNPATRRVVAELPGGGWFGGEVSPDESQLALTRYVSATESEVWLVDLASGQRRRVLPAPTEALRASHFAHAWSRDGRQLFFTSDRAGEFRELMRLDLASGALQRLTADTPWDVHGAEPSHDGRRMAVIVNADGRDEVRLLDPASGAAWPLPALPGGSITRGAFHPAADELALVVNSAQGPSQIHTLDLARGTVTAWTHPVGTEGLDLASLPEPGIVRWKSFDGRTISGVLNLPPARFTGRRPVVMVMHGGPESQAKQGWIGRLNYLTQELGVAVLQPNVRGSSGYGKTFLDLDNGGLREDSVKDMGSAIDWVATQPRLDAARVLVMGGSYGGYMALAASTRLAGRIAGASSTVGISNFVSFLENTESYRRDLRRVEYGDERDATMRAFLQGISPLTHADKITRPLMVVQGRNDPRVPWTESEQIVRRLQARGTPVWYLLADNEGHGFARRENADFYFAAQLLFIARTLAPER
ncbi:MAG: prolyl oligopeptidase family serine peptidase [Rubrivivax sp.]|nr:prolyl oligopeptidase family serine peptidase [Rubrivivax sp.]